jgi:hypothetical protein
MSTGTWKATVTTSTRTSIESQEAKATSTTTSSMCVESTDMSHSLCMVGG